MALEFYSTSNAADGITFTSSMTSINSISFACWLYPDALASYNGILTCRDSGLQGMLLSGSGGNPLTYSWENSSDEWNGATGLNPTTGQWNFFGVSIAPTVATLYHATSRGATLSNYVNTKTHNTKTVGGWRLGRDNSNVWDGRLSELGIWDAALTESEMTSLSRGFKPSFVRPQSLKTYMPLLQTYQEITGRASSLAYAGSLPVVQTHPAVLCTR